MTQIPASDYIQRSSFFLMQLHRKTKNLKRGNPLSKNPLIWCTRLKIVILSEFRSCEQHDLKENSPSVRHMKWREDHSERSSFLLKCHYDGEVGGERRLSRRTKDIRHWTWQSATNHSFVRLPLHCILLLPAPSFCHLPCPGISSSSCRSL